jgi:hypothetical protein
MDDEYGRQPDRCISGEGPRSTSAQLKSQRPGEAGKWESAFVDGLAREERAMEYSGDGGLNH